jgi:hypothetical protein
VLCCEQAENLDDRVLELCDLLGVVFAALRAGGAAARLRGCGQWCFVHRRLLAGRSLSNPRPASPQRIALILSLILTL